MTVTENGYGKRTPIEEYLRSVSCEAGEKTAQNRGGLGLKNYNITEKTGKVAVVKVVDDNDDILIISDDGTIIRTAASDISTYSRATMGVKLMRIGDDARVVSIARTEKEDEEDLDDEQRPAPVKAQAWTLEAGETEDDEEEEAPAVDDDEDE